MTRQKKDLQSEKSNYKNLQTDDFSIVDTILIVSRNLKIIIITPVIFCILTIMNVQYFVKPIYTSTSKIMSGSDNKTSQAAGLVAQFGINIPTFNKEVKWVYSEIVKSRTLAKSMLKRKFNTIKYGPEKSLLQILSYGDGVPEFSIDTLEIMVTDDFLDMVDVSEDKLTGIYTIEISASEPKLASDLNRALIEELDIHQKDYNRSKTSDTRQFIEDRIIDVGKELETTEEALRDFSIRNRRIENSPALQLEQQRLSREVAVLTGVFTTLKQQLETTKIEEVKESDYVIVIDAPEIPINRSKPKKKEAVILAGLLGIGLGTLIGFIKEYIEKSNPEEKVKMNEVKSLFWKNLVDLFRFRF